MSKHAALGCIMAGGKSSRMGTNKALLDFQGQKLIERVADRFVSWFDQVLLVTNTPDTYQFLGLPMVGDRIPGAGPLGGIEAGLRVSRCPLMVVAACDMPFLDGRFVDYMLGQASGVDAVVPYLDGQFEPLHAVYAKSCLPIVNAHLDSGVYKVARFFDQVRVRRIEAAEVAPFGAPERLFFNCNTPEDLSRALELAKS